MTSLKRTAYPTLKTPLSRQELHLLYKPSEDEIVFTRIKGRGLRQRLTVLVLLKTFQHLGYFLPPHLIPDQIVNYIGAQTGWEVTVNLKQIPEVSLYRYHQEIREYLHVRTYQDGGHILAEGILLQSVQTMDDPADLINTAIEELIHQRYELPAFSTLNRLANHVRTQFNEYLFNDVMQQLTSEEMQLLHSLPLHTLASGQTAFVTLKQVPGTANLTELQNVEARLTWLKSLIDVRRLLAGISSAKKRHFAAEARSLEATALREVNPPKRFTLLLALIHQAQVQTRDHLVEIFIKRMNHLNKRATEALREIHEKQRSMTEHMLAMFAQIVHQVEAIPENEMLGYEVRQLMAKEGGLENLRKDVEALLAYRDNNHLPLIYRFYASHRRVLFRLTTILDIRSDDEPALIEALRVIQLHQDSRTEWLPATLDLEFTSEKWRTLILHEREDGTRWLNRRHLEVCVFAALAHEFLSGDVYVMDADHYADYHDQLLAWEMCEPFVEDYCMPLGLATNAKDFVTQLKHRLTQVAQAVDQAYPNTEHWYFDKSGKPVLRRVKRGALPAGAKELRRVLQARMPDRSLLDVLCNVHHWVNFTRHFGPVSGTERHMKKTASRYLLTTFGYSCNLGPAQTARHSQTPISPRIIAYINRQHITAERLDAAINDIINHYIRFDLPRFWGTGKVVAADGTQMELIRNNLLAERHIRYGGYGGIAYHHISDTYIALFSHFIACGVWEAVYIIDGLLKNASDIQPDTIHADTQGQSEPVFGLSYLLGIHLMPRIRNWHDLILYRPSANTRYQHIQPLFRGVIDWHLIETHWQDLMQVVISIKAGKFLPSLLLRKLGTYSRKNRLYRAFRELGKVIRTIFLLEYMNSLPLRQQITAATNKVEGYHRFVKWLFFGGLGIITHSDAVEQEKRIKYTDLMANAVILQNVIDMTSVLRQLAREGYQVTPETLATLSPYMTEHIRRFGNYVVNLDVIPPPLELDIPLLEGS